MENERTERPTMPLIGDIAPSFQARTTKGRTNFPEDYKGKWVIFFSHPADFTPVCTTEFIKFATMQEEFKQLNTELIGLSVDSLYSHISWLAAIKEKVEYKGLKGIDIDFPIVEDLNMEVSRKYGMIHPRASYTPEEVLEKLETTGGSFHFMESTTETVRAVFIIDPRARIRAMMYYPFSNGRNLEEIKRLLMAMQVSDKHNVETPENWHPGEDVILPNPVSWDKAKERLKKGENGKACGDWFLCLKEDPETR
jgi:peroxiredoxin (alkyl hydroperoxide reductase subunit C)